MSGGEISLEVCVDSIVSALAAVEGGASRIELCSALSEGGLTPTCGTLNTLKQLPFTIPIYCMLRPRRGNDFVYTQLEMQSILSDMNLLRQHGADGFVFGALTEQRTIDVEKCQQVIRRAEGLPVTFHRAFDMTDPNIMHDTINRLKEIGFKRVLSSGFRQSAAEGVDFLAQLIAKHHKNIIVIPGAGITVENLDELLTVTKCTEFHASAKSAADGPTLCYGDTAVDSCGGSRMECDVTMGKQDVDPYETTDVRIVRKMVSIARAMASK